MEVDERHVNHQVLDICGAIAMAPLLVKNKVKPEWTKQILCKTKFVKSPSQGNFCK